MQNIKRGIEGHPATWYSDVFDLLFADLDKGTANQIWRKELAEPTKKKANEDEHDD